MTYRPFQDALQRAIDRIYSDYGDVVSTIAKGEKALNKFGRTNNASSDLSTVMQLAGTEDNETYAATDSIDSAVCTDNSFTGDISIEGHRNISSNLVFQVPSVAGNNALTMTGNTPKSLGTSLARATRGVIVTNDALAEGQFIYIYDSAVATTAPSGIPSDDTAVKLIIPGGRYRQSQKASTSVSSTDYWLVKKWYASIGANKTATAEAYLQIRNPFTDEFRTIDEFFLSDQQPKPPPAEYDDYLIIPKNHDVRVVVITVGSSPASAVTITSRLQGILALVTG
jgi:hypothetical protein